MVSSCLLIGIVISFTLLTTHVKAWHAAFFAPQFRQAAGRHPRLMTMTTTANGAVVSERSRAIFDKMDKQQHEQQQQQQTGGAGGSSTLKGLLALDANWEALKNGGWSKVPPQIVREHPNTFLPSTSGPIFDVAVSGGTLGIFYAMALLKQGKSVVVVERGKIQGRQQEWNISKKELNALIRSGILTQQELESCIVIEFNPVRVGFKTDTAYQGEDPKRKGFELYTKDVLNLGISPDLLIALVRNKFIEAGGVVFEQSSLTKIDVYDNCASLSLATGASVQARLVLDCMGNASPIGKQIRGPVEPDGVCIVVGTCARGYPSGNNTYSDLIYTDTPISKMANEESSVQYFWEAFPTSTGSTDRTTYLFAYMDAAKERPSVAQMLDDYWELLPRYQGIALDDLEILRVLYGVFPTYRASPLQTTLNRILQVGDASGVQSPLSFGGFGSLTRHLERIVGAVCDALAEPSDELLSREHLSLINAYQPNLSACWMFQRSMSVPVSRTSECPPDQVVGTLQNSFSAMQSLGEDVMRPFLQDVLQFGGLARILLKAGIQDPLTPLKIVPHVGIVPFADFFVHFAGMAYFTLLHHSPLGKVIVPQLASWKALSSSRRFALARAVEAWKFGSGQDYNDHE